MNLAFTNLRQYLTTDPEASEGGNKLHPSVVDTFRWIVECNDADDYYCAAGNPEAMSTAPRWVRNLRAARDMARGMWDAAMCDLMGHRWEVESHAGPDTGWEHFHCTRCGMTHEITHY